MTPDSPSLRVSGKALDKFKKVIHRFAVLSLQDIFSFEEFKDWEDRNKKIIDGHYDYFCELKLDGLTVVLTYENGILKTSATRGNGKIGEDVTNNVRTIESIPLRLRKGKYNIPKILSIRGEILLTKSYFEKMNKKRVKQGLEPYANPRNIAAGSIRQLNPKIAAQRKLVYFAYDIKEDIGQKTHEQVHEMLKEFGFKINTDNLYCKDLKNVREYLNKWESKRKSLNYLTDGVVIVVNNIDLQRKLGSVGKSERWMIAYKFPAKQVTSKVKDIIIQVGRTGALTPVAVLEPRSLSGSIVSRATLHNFDEIKRLDIKIGDTVIIQKAGEIIPEIVKVLPRLRTGKQKRVSIPKKCPVCGSSVFRKKGEVNYYCANKKCHAIQKQGIVHFISKKAFNIEGFGHKIVEQLMNHGLLRNVADIFKLKKDDLVSLERFADKSADNLIDSIYNSKSIDLDRFIYALGIRYVGEETSIILANKFGSLENLRSASKEQLENIHDIGPKAASGIYNYFNNKKNIKLIDELVDLGVIIKGREIKHQKLKNKVFVLTGTLEKLTREQVKKEIRDLGGKIFSSVSNNVNYVVVGKDPGSKYEKAKELGIKIINEKEFIKLLNC